MEHLANIWDSIALVVMLSCWGKERKKCSDKQKILIFVVMLTLFLINIEICDLLNTPALVPIAIDFFIVLAFCWNVMKQSWRRGIEAYLIFYFLNFSSTAIASIWLEKMRYQGILGWADTESATRPVYLVMAKILLATGIGFTILFVNKGLPMIRRIVQKKCLYRWIFIWSGMILPIAAFTVCLQLMQELYHIQETKNQNKIITVYMTILVLMLTVIILTIYVSKLEIAWYENRKKNIMLQQEKEHFHKIIEYERNFNKFKHDLKNRILGIEYLLMEENAEQGICKLQELLSDFHFLNSDLSESRQIWDLIIECKLRDAEIHDLQVEKKVNLKTLHSVDEVDFGILMGNLLDNAIEALRQVDDRRLKIVLDSDKGYLFMEISNSCAAHSSTHKDSLYRIQHGFGLESVKEIVQKYHGTYTAEQKEEFYRVNILIPDENIANNDIFRRNSTNL